MSQLLKKLIEPSTDCIDVTRSLLKLLNVKVSLQTIKKDIEDHPDYPSLLSISDTLRLYGVENITASFSIDKLVEIDMPFITRIKDSQSNSDIFIIVRNADDQGISYLDTRKGKWVLCPKDEFSKISSGIVLLAEANEMAGEKDFQKKNNADKRNRLGKYFAIAGIPVITFIAIAAAFVQYGTNALPAGVFTLLTLAGSVTGAILLLFEYDEYNPALKQICGMSKKVNCNAILHSNASKIAGISWSLIGFTYFSGILFMLILAGINNPQALFIVSWLNVLAAPYVFYSIYYQWRIAKQWCTLCLSVQALLVLQLAIALPAGWHTLPAESLPFAGLFTLFIFSFAFPSITIAVFIQMSKRGKDSKHFKRELYQLKHNPDIFEAVSVKQTEITSGTDGLGIKLGNANAKNKIIKVCNPFCGPCAGAHKPLKELLSTNPDVQVQIIFTATTQENDTRLPIVRHLMAIAEKFGEDAVEKALDDWYGAQDKSYDAFAAKYPMNGELKIQEDKIQAMESWCKEARIAFTPTFFVNGYQLAKIYTIDNLRYLLSE